MEWRREAEVSMGVSERAFYVTRGDEQVPGLLWAPEGRTEGLPLVLIGHGGKSQKRNPFDLALARRFVRRHGIAVCAIDAVDHGERGPIVDTGDGPAQAEFLELWKQPETFDRMNADWMATLDDLMSTGMFNERAVGYWGLSMGTILGLPLVAREKRISAAVLGACGFTGPGGMSSVIADRLRGDAPQVTCSAMFMLQWDDEIFDRQGALELFDAIGTRDKRMHVHLGRHGAFPQEATDAGRAFLAAHLSVAGQTDSGLPASESVTA